ncbi:hypothetical protein SAMN05892883_3652 [Jatrophihabitans sp. GAS493]|nr:hypothetical protein SAMN05892883_3652 [Jatrophihabitans sp. GAS493]
MVCALTLFISISISKRRWSRIPTFVPAGGWGAVCVDARSRYAWRGMLLESSGLRLVTAKGMTVGTLSWRDIAETDVGAVTVANTVVSHVGLILTLKTGRTLQFLFPSPTTMMTYPSGLALRAASEIDRRRGAAIPSDFVWPQE